MTTRLHLGTDEARSLLCSPLTLLAWLEAKALEFSLVPFLRRARESDSWYFSRDGETFGPTSFGEIEKILLRGDGPVQVLHASDTESEVPPWQVVQYRAWPVSAPAALAWIAGFWLLVAAFGYVVVILACPVPARSAVGVIYLVLLVAAAVWLGWRARRAPAAATEGSPRE